MVSPAICSAACTAVRIASSACSMSMMAPLRTPRRDWWPMPTTRGRPSSDPGDEAADLGGADVERGDQAVARGDARFLDHVALSFGLSPAGASSSSGTAGCARRSTTLVRQAQVDDRARPVPGCRAGSAASARRDQAAPASLLRQPHVDAVVEAQVPAPLADEHGRGHPLLQLRLLRQQVEQALGALRRVVAHDHQQLGVVAQVRGLDHLAVAADQEQLLLALPQRQRLGFRHRHHRRSG